MRYSAGQQTRGAVLRSVTKAIGRSSLAAVLLMNVVAVKRMDAQADSTHIALESGVYSTVEELSQKGVLPPVWLNMRPWTFSVVKQIVQEAKVPDDPEDALRLDRLRRMLEGEAPRDHLAIVSLRQRITGVAGTSIEDGYHFAQTNVNDRGRTLAQGSNLFTGVTFRGYTWHLAGVLEGELQRIPNAAPLSAAAVAAADFTPTAMMGPKQGVLQGKILDAYVVLPFHGNLLAVGKQALWWGPARSGATLFSSNAGPIAMVRYERVEPIRLPGPISWLGELRVQGLVGRLSGAQFIHADHQTFGTAGRSLKNQPWIHAIKLSFHPANSFEFGVSRSVLFAGAGSPFTARSFLKSFFSAGTGNEQNDPGDRRIAFDAAWLLPRTKGCVRTYVDTFTEDEPFPLAYVKESAWITGFTWNCIPHARRWSVRAEGLVSPHRDILPGFYYFNVQYLSGYTQQRQLIGSWIGREGRGSEVWMKWRQSPSLTLEMSQRSMRVDHEFLQGGSLYDTRLTARHATGDGRWEWETSFQAERWRFPILDQGARFNVLIGGQVVWHPFLHGPE